MAEAATRLPVKTEKSTPPAVERDWMPFETAFPATGQGWMVSPAFDVVERDKEYEITAELPGIDEKNVEIRLTNHQLTIRGQKTEAKEEKDKDYFLSERRFGSFQRSFLVPDGVDVDRIEASFAKGVLTVRLPKTAAAQQAERTISVKAA
jgi:HSP20 family protein